MTPFFISVSVSTSPKPRPFRSRDLIYDRHSSSKSLIHSDSCRPLRVVFRVLTLSPPTLHRGPNTPRIVEFSCPRTYRHGAGVGVEWHPKTLGNPRVLQGLPSLHYFEVMRSNLLVSHNLYSFQNLYWVGYWYVSFKVSDLYPSLDWFQRRYQI